MEAPMSTTRGVSFDPAASAAQRELAKQREKRQRADVDRRRVQAQARSDVSPRKAQAIYLDQVERCYREHVPPQRRRRS